MAVDAIPVRLPTNLVAVTIPLKYASEPVKNPTVVIPDTYKELKEPIPPITSMAVDAIPVRLPIKLLAVMIPVVLILELSVSPCAIVAIPAVDAYPADVTTPTIDDADILCKLLPSP